MTRHRRSETGIPFYFSLILIAASSMGYANEKNFIGFRQKCKSEENQGPETSPQSPPLTIDDPDTPGCNRIEINVTFDGDFSKGESSRSWPLVDLNYGIGDNLQLKYEVPYIYDTDGHGTTSEWGDPKAGVKYHFYENEQQELNISAYPQVEWVHSKSERGHIVTLPFLLSKKVAQTAKGDIITALNLGYTIAHNIDMKNALTISAGIGTPLTKDIGLMGEISSQQAIGHLPEERREQIIFANLGFLGTLTPSLKLFGSLGSSLVSSDEKQHVYALAGVRWISEGQSSHDVEQDHESRSGIHE